MAAKERIEGEEAKDQAREQPKEPAWSDVKSDVAKTLIEAMQKGETPWQKPWSSQSMRPRNPVTGNAYKGINRILLSLAGGNGLWVTYRQAQAQGWQVRKGEKGAMIVKVVELDPAKEQGAAQPVSSKDANARRNVILRRYYVFGAHQIEGMPELEPPGELDFHPVDKAEAVLKAMQERTGLKIKHGGNEACYVPGLDEVRLPAKKAFKSVYDYYAVALHECAHSSLAKHRLDRRDALGKRWGDEAYALEELRAEIASAIMASDMGIQMNGEQRAKHMASHAGYLQSWIKALSKDPSAIFAAAKDAERITEYIMGLERQATAMQEHKEWVAEFDAAPLR
ncbi:ArdC family protein [Ramlibacter sp.]|uniref:ArdC family protein n=1 Tax=Ramlibacter sp. TaxID=1917967 RepID=UPI003D097606